ncbi:MAG: tetratricopeptide repeat protein [Methylovirgula sp.]
MRVITSWKTPAAGLLTALLLAGCQGIGMGDLTGSVASNAALPSSTSQLERYTEDLGRSYDADPNNIQIALAYARALRALTRTAQAVAVTQKLAARYPKDMNVLGAYGKALADDGRLREAASVLPEAHTPEQPNWSILSAQGVVADQLGDHDQAQAYYTAALKIIPNQPQVLSNLGLSYALSKQLPLAESTLQQAAAQPGADMRVRQNLALVLALEGKFDAAQSVAQQDLSPVDAAENVASIREMIAQANPWDQIRQLDKKTAQRNRPQRDAKRRVLEPTRLGAADPE